MEDLTIEQWMEKYPYLRNIARYTLFTSKEECEQLKNSEKMKIGSEEVSIEFLKKILNNDFYFDYASRYFNNDTDNFCVSYIINGDIDSGLSYKKSTIIKGLELLILSEKIMLNANEEQKYKSLKKGISFEKFFEVYKENIYNIDIDGNNYSFPVEQLLILMQLPEEQFDNLCSNKKIKDINGVPKEHLIYATLNFFRESNAMADYFMPENIVKRYSDIASFKKIDLQSINKHLTTKDTKYQNIQIDESLERSILAGLPETVTNLEKAIYIYIKMCKLLTYDEEYYAVDQKGIAAEKHKDIDYISTITLDNNKVVCFEFNLMYSKLLNALGINFASNYAGVCDENDYGEGHANLEFRSNKFLVSADSVTSILMGDIMQAKLNQPLVGLKCINKNQQTQQEFNDFLTKMYQLIAEQDKNINVNQPVEHIQTLDELLEEYSHLTKNIQDVNLNERLSILIDKVNSTKMVGIDSLSYVLQLKKVLFTEEQRKNNIDVTIIRNNEPFEEGRIAMATAVISLNGRSFEEYPEENIYYYFNPNHNLIAITKEELQAKFNEGIFAYVANDDPRIPGIVEGGGVKK